MLLPQEVVCCLPFVVDVNMTATLTKKARSRPTMWAKYPENNLGRAVSE